MRGESREPGGGKSLGVPHRLVGRKAAAGMEAVCGEEAAGPRVFAGVDDAKRKMPWRGRGDLSDPNPTDTWHRVAASGSAHARARARFAVFVVPPNSDRPTHHIIEACIEAHM
uniref:Uncharacterized protein n=1 Tax=Oryza brachyantha TaxID=4533 RepID=J3MH14_ORYBR